MSKKRLKAKEKYAYLSSGLNNLNQLRETQLLVARDIRRSERRMSQQYNDAIRMFSYKNMICSLLSKADDVQALVRYASYGYDMVNGFMSVRHGRKKNCG